MELYYLCENNEQLGPFSINQLRQKGINQDTPIWKEGFIGWAKAGKVDEFKDILPPPIATKTPVEEKVDFRMSKSLNGIGLIILIVVLSGFIVYKNQQASPAVPLILSMAPVVSGTPAVKEKQKEKKPINQETAAAEKGKQNPSQYLLSNTSMRKNLVRKNIFEGTIINKASTTIYKDVVLLVQFLSKTDGKIGSEKFTIHEIIPPRQKIKFKFKTHSPAGTKGFRVGVIEAGSIE